MHYLGDRRLMFWVLFGYCESRKEPERADSFYQFLELGLFFVGYLLEDFGFFR